MDNSIAKQLPQHRASILSTLQQQRLREVLKLMDGLWSLPLENDSVKGEKIKNIYGKAEKREKK
jgi:hypothetical protein